jgi:hypothetical protein
VRERDHTPYMSMDLADIHDGLTVAPQLVNTQGGFQEIMRFVEEVSSSAPSDFCVLISLVM